MSRFPFPIPNGWFPVATTEELRAGDVLSRRYFARDLVVFRAESGEAHVLDAYCVHMGAHLGIGAGEPEDKAPGPGLVVDDCIQCPFHGWQYDGEGVVVDIPYSDARIPAKARVRSFPTREFNGVIFAWHHLLGEPPAWEVPQLEEFDDDEWFGPIYTERTIASCNQELSENDHDFVHFAYVHTAESPRKANVTYSDDGRIKTTTEIIEAGRDIGGGSMTFEEESPFSRESHQLGFVVLRIPGYVTFMAATTPIDEEHVHQRWVFAIPKELGEEAADTVVGAFASSGIYQDIPIWEYKRHLEHPLLVKGDGPIMEFRRWASQFYSDPAEFAAGS
jgi:phenylpropionate dioxygenase-like ring-hydroxylating dioxygenase large terminal subunit